jgi:CHASE2 domain-containing sensor protein/predicted Ser/Thr protein kinase
MMIRFQPEQQIIHYRINQEIGSGGFAITYLVTDTRNGKPKVLKILDPERAKDEKSLEWFKKEAKALQKLNHPGIPSVQEGDGYFAVVQKGDESFTLALADDQPLFHCFVMEWINGKNLDKYVDQKKKIDQDQSIDWLKQLVEILDVVHQNELIHRDIKPSNVLFRYEDEALVLIDFGIAREMSQTFHDRQERGIDHTRVGTPGYQAPEVWRGEVCKQSDFFSLGRTFVFLTTGKPIGEFAKDEQGNLNWHNDAPQLSRAFKKLLDWLMQQEPNQRPPDTQALLDDLNTRDFAVDKAETTQVDTQPTKRPRQVLAQLPQKALVAISSAFLSTVAVVGLRYVGVLQSTELAVFDQMMRLRPPLKQDEHILIVQNTQYDYQRYKNQFRSSSSSISDESLLKLLTILNQNHARIIGLDISRDFETRNNPTLKKALASDNLYGVCELAGIDGKGGVGEPKDLPGFGFSNIPYDGESGNIVRQQLLARDPKPTGCQETNSFAVRLAFDYLHQQGKSLPENDSCNAAWILGQITLPFLKAGQTGFYRLHSLAGAECQILLNSRPGWAPQNFPTVTLSEILDGNVSEDQIAGKIVLIGTTDSSWGDTDWVLPGQSDYPIAGVFVHAEMVNYLVDIGLGKRSTLRFWMLWQDAVWILGWAVLGSMMPLFWRSRPVLFTVSILGLIGLSIVVSWFFFLQLGILVATVPTTLVILLSSLGWLIDRQLTQRT